MTVKELKARLEEFNENAVVVFPWRSIGWLC